MAKYTWNDVIVVRGRVYFAGEELSTEAAKEARNYTGAPDEFYNKIAERFDVDTDDIKTFTRDGYEKDGSFYIDERKLCENMNYTVQGCGLYMDGVKYSTII